MYILNITIHLHILSVSQSVQLLSRVRLFVTPWTATCQASLSFTISQSLLKVMSIGLVILSNHHILCHPFLLLPSIFLSIRAFTYSYQVAKVLELQLHINSSNEYSGLISFGIDWSISTVKGSRKSHLWENHREKVLYSAYKMLEIMSDTSPRVNVEKLQ